MLFIRDGYTQKGRVEADSKFGLDALTFTYRPALPEVRYEHARCMELPGKERAAKEAEILKAHLIEWDAKEREQAVPLTVENLRCLHGDVLAKVRNQVLGYDLPDGEADAKN